MVANSSRTDQTMYLATIRWINIQLYFDTNTSNGCPVLTLRFDNSNTNNIEYIHE